MSPGVLIYSSDIRNIEKAKKNYYMDITRKVIYASFTLPANVHSKYVPWELIQA